MRHAGLRYGPGDALRLARVWPTIADLPLERLANAVAALLGRSQDEAAGLARVVERWASPPPHYDWRPSRLWWPLLAMALVWVGWVGWRDWKASRPPKPITQPSWFVDEDGDGLPRFGDFSKAKDAPGPEVRFDLCDTDALLGATPVALGLDLDGDGYASPLLAADGSVSMLAGCTRGPGQRNLDADATDCDDGRQDIHPGAPDVGVDGFDQDCDGADGPLPPACPEDLAPLDPYRRISTAGLSLAALLAVLGAVVGLGLELGWRLLSRAQVARARLTVGALPAPRALELDLPPLVAPLPLSAVRSAVTELLGAQGPEGGRLDVRRTVAETARRGGAPSLLWLPALAGQDLDLWVERGGRLAPWTPRIDALVEDLRTLGLRVRLAHFDATGRFDEAPASSPGRPLLVVGLGEAGIAGTALASAWADRRRRVWLHPSADHRQHPTGVAPILPFDAEGLRAAFSVLRGGRLREGASSPLAETDRLRLIWLHGVADLLRPEQSARLLRALAPRTPEAVGLADWLPPRTASEWPALWREARDVLRAAADPLVADEARVRARIGEILAASEPTAGSFAHALWRRERAWQALGAGDREQGLVALDVLRAEGLASLLPLGRDRLAPDTLKAHERARLEGLRRSWALARGAQTGAPNGIPALGVGLVAGGLALAVVLARPALPERVEGDLTLRVGPDGAASLAVTGDGVGSEAVVVRQARGEALRSSALALGGVDVGLDPLETGECAQVVAWRDDGRLAVSNVAGNRTPAGLGRLVVKVDGVPAEVKGLDLWLRCGETWTAQEVPLRGETGEVALNVRACDYAATWVAWGAEVRWLDHDGSLSVLADAATSLDVPADVWPVPPEVRGSVELGQAPVWVRLSLRDPGGRPFNGGLELLPLDEYVGAPAIADATIPILAGRWRVRSEDASLCSQPFEITGGTRAAPERLVVPLRSCAGVVEAVAWFTVALPYGVGLEEVYVKPLNGGQFLGIEKDRLKVSAAPDGDAPFDYNLEIGGSTRLFTERPKAGVYYDETDRFAVERGQSYAADLRGEPKIGVVEVYATEFKHTLQEYVDLDGMEPQYGTFDGSLAAMAGWQGRVWVATRQGMLMIPLQGGGSTSRYVTAGTTASLAFPGAAGAGEISVVDVYVACGDPPSAVRLPEALKGASIGSVSLTFDDITLPARCVDEMMRAEVKVAMGGVLSEAALRADVENLSCLMLNQGITVSVRGFPLREGVRADVSFEIEVNKGPDGDTETLQRLSEAFCDDAATTD